MKEFKAFYVNLHENKQLFKAVLHHLTYIGYKGSSKVKRGNYFTTFRSGDYFAYDEFKNVNGDKLTLDEFFALTPADVMVEPERFECRFRKHYSGFFDSMSRDLTQSQIDEIKDIMERES